MATFIKNNTTVLYHSNLQNLDYASSGHTGFASSADLSSLTGTVTSHVADATIHFTEGSIDHTAITNIGSNTHAQIDTHITTAAAHIASTSNPHTVTLDQVLSANPISAIKPQFTDIQIAGVVDNATSTDDPFRFVSDTDDETGFGVPQYSFEFSRTGNASLGLISFENGTSTNAVMGSDGQLYKGELSGGNKYVYESLSPTWTGTHDFTGASITLPATSVLETMLDVAVGASGTVLTSNGVGVAPTYQASGGGASDFTDLGDVPGSYATFNSHVVAVNAGATGLEFVNPLGANNTWTAEQVFSAGISLLDNDIATFGTGDDLSIYHDGTNNLFTSNVALTEDDQPQGFKLIWGVDADATNGNRNAWSWPGRPGDSGLAPRLLEMGITKSAGTYQSMFGFYPYLIPPSGKSGPGFILNLNNADQHGGSIGFTEDDDSTSFSGMYLDDSRTALIFTFDHTEAFRANAGGIVIGGSSSSILKSFSGFTLNLESALPTAVANKGNVQVQHSGNHTVAATAPTFSVVTKNTSTETRTANVWHTGAARSAAGFGVGSGHYLTFDDTISGTLAQGDTSIHHASAALHFNVDGTEVLTLGNSVPNVTGSRGGNAALASLLTTLATLGLITDGSS